MSPRALVKRDALNGSQVEVAFDAPTKEWVAKRNAPTIDMYLYDIREDTHPPRSRPGVDVRDETGIVKERRLPPRRFRLSYLVTAWTQRPEDEHRLLSAMLSCFVRHEYMPPELLTGVARRTRTCRSSCDVALPPSGGPLDCRRLVGDGRRAEAFARPRSIIAPLDVERSLAAGPPVQETPCLEWSKPSRGTTARAGTARGPATALAGRRRRQHARCGLAGSELGRSARRLPPAAAGGAGRDRCAARGRHGG